MENSKKDKESFAVLRSDFCNANGKQVENKISEVAKANKTFEVGFCALLDVPLAWEQLPLEDWSAQLWILNAVPNSELFFKKNSPFY